MSLSIGSLFSGIGGLERALESHGMTVAWQVENDAYASAVLERHWPGVPNHGDITSVDWNTVEPVDVLCGGFPCQDISYAGKGAGIADGTRSGLWSYFADAIGILRPRYVFVENVSALAVRGLDRVTADLAALGYVGRTCAVRASDVGAPHRRERLFILATDADEQRINGAGSRCSGWSEPAHGDSSLTDADRTVEQARSADRVGNQGVGRLPPVGGGLTDWGEYASAVARWEAIAGRPAPRPTDERGRLAPEFVEWLMGFPQGWTEGMPRTPRTQRLKCLGNSVVPMQGALAWSVLAGVAVST